MSPTEPTNVLFFLPAELRADMIIKAKPDQRDIGVAGFILPFRLAMVLTIFIILYLNFIFYSSILYSWPIFIRILLLLVLSKCQLGSDKYNL